MLNSDHLLSAIQLFTGQVVQAIHRLADVNRFGSGRNYLNNSGLLPVGSPRGSPADDFGFVNRPVRFGRALLVGLADVNNLMVQNLSG